MSVSMFVDFQILKKNSNGGYEVMGAEEFKGIQAREFVFEIGNKKIPFHWNRSVVFDNNGAFTLITGEAENNYSLSDAFDAQYKGMGLKREDINAELLSSVTHIEDFLINFQVGSNMFGLGAYTDNSKSDPEYKLNLIEISFEDIKNNMFFDVKPDVINAFNKGEKGRKPLEQLISDSANQVVEPKSSPTKAVNKEL